MAEDKKDKRQNERRKGRERRTGDMESLFRRAVARGIFEDIRKGDRRKSRDRRKQLLDIRVYFN